MYDPLDPTLRPRLTRGRLRCIGLGVIAASVVMAAAFFAWDWQLRSHSRDSAAARQVARMVVAHLEANNGAWPRSWDELRPYHGRAATVVEEPVPFDELSSRVIVDFFAEPEELLRKKQSFGHESFRVIYLRSGWTDEPVDPQLVPVEVADANEIVYRYVSASHRMDEHQMREALQAFVTPGSATVASDLSKTPY
jgi:hypothetical protein